MYNIMHISIYTSCSRLYTASDSQSLILAWFRGSYSLSRPSHPDSDLLPLFPTSSSWLGQVATISSCIVEFSGCGGCGSLVSPQTGSFVRRREAAAREGKESARIIMEIVCSEGLLRLHVLYIKLNFGSSVFVMWKENGAPVKRLGAPNLVVPDCLMANPVVPGKWAGFLELGISCGYLFPILCILFRFLISIRSCIQPEVLLAWKI
ncbi:hypothetical protein F5Y06DRAFT_234631 [Hypoxylon sp. FL0890]|nr:hypothetical protein F5Y06DRAFT_234631 [Hypoxylon sp. FL0890]